MGIRTSFNTLGKKSISRELHVPVVMVGLTDNYYTEAFCQDVIKISDSEFLTTPNQKCRTSNYGRTYKHNVKSLGDISSLTLAVDQYVNLKDLNNISIIGLEQESYNAPYEFSILKSSSNTSDKRVVYTITTNYRNSAFVFIGSVGDNKLFLHCTFIDTNHYQEGDLYEHRFFISEDNGETWIEASDRCIDFVPAGSMAHFTTFSIGNKAFMDIPQTGFLVIDDNFNITIGIPTLAEVEGASLAFTPICNTNNILYAIAISPEINSSYAFYVYSTDGLIWHILDSRMFYLSKYNYTNLYTLSSEDYLGLYINNTQNFLKVLNLNDRNVRGLTIDNPFSSYLSEPFNNLLEGKLLYTTGDREMLMAVGLPNLNTIWTRLEDVESEYGEKEVFKFTVDSGTDSSFIIPTSGRCGPLNNNNFYNWNIDWGDGVVENHTGTSDNWDGTCTGISHVYPNANTHYQITIKPNTTQLGWLQCFGFYGQGGTNASSAENKQKMLSLDSPLTKNAIANRTYTVGICMYMFIECTNLTMGPEFNLPFDLTTAAGNCFQGMFLDCTSLKMNDIFNIPSLLTEVGPYCMQEMFGGCTSLTMNNAFTLKGIKDLSPLGMFAYMFKDCTSLDLNDTFEIANDIFDNNIFGDEFLKCTFMNCSSLTKIANLLDFRFAKSFGNDCLYMTFRGCSKLVSIPNISITCNKSIGNNFGYGLFYECTSIGSFYINTNAAIYGDNFLYAFNPNNPALSSLHLHIDASGSESLTIGNFCLQQGFANCTSLDRVYAYIGLNSTTIIIGNDFFNQAFMGMSNIRSVDLYFPTSEGTSIVVGNNFLYGLCVGSTGAFRDGLTVNLRYITSIGNNFLYGIANNCPNFISNIYLPTDITDAKEGFLAIAFAGCSKFEFDSSFVLPQNLTTIGKNFLQRTFLRCTSITDGIINFFGNLKFTQEQLDQENVFEYTFNGCTGLTESLSELPLLQVSPSQTNHCFNNTTTVVTNSVPTNWK